MSLLLHADDQVAWSQPVKGLRARLFFSPNRDPETDNSYQVYIQFENVGVVGNLGLIREERTFSYSEQGLALDLTDANDQKLPVKPLAIFDGFILSMNLCVPFGGNLTFPIGHISGSGRKEIVISPFLTWDISSMRPGAHYLSGTFTTKFPRPNPPRNIAVRMNWEGTLILPPVEIPQK
jgi:hypothetical protein